jgi:enediyne biosynthesis protein E4
MRELLKSHGTFTPRLNITSAGGSFAHRRNHYVRAARHDIPHHAPEALMKLARLSLLAILLTSQLYAVDDTLRHWNRYTGQFTAYTALGGNVPIALQCARFTPRAPGFVKSVIIYFGGPGTGSATILLYGHEAGSHIPFLGPSGYAGATKAQATFNKTVAGTQAALFNLPTPLWVTGNQFWIGIGNLPANMYVLSDTTQIPPTCTAGQSGGDFYRQVLFGTGGQIAVGPRAYAIDVIMDYPALSSPQYFRDATASVGLPTNLSNGSTAFADFDNDGYLDFLITGRLFKNSAGTSFTEITAAAGLSGSPRANAFVDIDNDGDLDILFINNNAKSVVFVNNGSGVCTARELSLPEIKAASSFSIADINNDGYPDLFVGQLWSVYDANGPDLLPNYFLLNNKNYDFTLQTGVCTTAIPRRSRGSEWVDFDNDGDLDLYVTNYFLEQDELYENDGNGNFTNVIDDKGIEKIVSTSPVYYNHGTGVDWADYDNDGDMDLLLPQFMHPNLARNGYEGTAIYRNNGAPLYTFTDLWPNTGIEYEETHAGGAFGDVNNDGLPDIMMSVYYGCRYADFYLQLADHTYENKTFEFGLENLTSGEDLAFVDFDNDGRLDLAFADNGQFRLFKNHYATANSYVELNLVSTTANKHAVGARVYVFAGGVQYMQEVVNGRGQRVEKPLRLHFGLGTATKVDSVLVGWPGKAGREKFGVAINSIKTLTEGTGPSTDVGQPGANVPFAMEIRPQDGRTEFRYSLYAPAEVTLSIFDVSGKHIASIVPGAQPTGAHTAVWTNEDGNGRPVTAGNYMYVLTAGGKTATGKLQIVR